MNTALGGIYAATITPFDESGQPSHDQLIAHLNHLKRKGCDGVLLCGTTGEGQSLTVKERVELVQAVSRADTGLRLLAGTGAASLEDAVTLSRAAFDSGVSGVVVIPPFFYKNAPGSGSGVLCAAHSASDPVRRYAPSLSQSSGDLHGHQQRANTGTGR